MLLRRLRWTWEQFYANIKAIGRLQSPSTACVSLLLGSTGESFARNSFHSRRRLLNAKRWERATAFAGRGSYFTGGKKKRLYYIDQEETKKMKRSMETNLLIKELGYLDPKIEPSLELATSINLGIIIVMRYHSFFFNNYKGSIFFRLRQILIESMQ